VGTEDYKVLKNLPKQGYQLHRDWRSGHSWLSDGTTFWTYDDPAQILQKTAYIRAEGLGGAMMWSLDGDDERASLTRPSRRVSGPPGGSPASGGVVRRSAHRPGRSAQLDHRPGASRAKPLDSLRRWRDLRSPPRLRSDEEVP
jgi:hypothetical protein